MRCNSNCSGNQNSCNRRGNNGGNFQPSNNQSMGFGYNNDFRGMYRRPSVIQNQCNVFAASTFTPTQTVKGKTPTPLAFQNILYSYGCAIQAANGACKINITQPGLYQVSYFVVATTNEYTEGANITVSILKDTTPISSKPLVIDKDKGEKCSTATDNAIVYVSCQDIPKHISLHAENPMATDTDSITYQVFITINRICSCNDASCGALGENTCCCNCNYGCGCYGGYPFYNNGYMPSSFGSAPNFGFGNEMTERNFTGSCGYSCNSGCGSSVQNGCSSSINNGCGCNS